MAEEIICVGGINYDLLLSVDRLPKMHEKLRCGPAYQDAGGSAGNTAHWLALYGKPVTFVGCVGDDPMGEACVARFERAGVAVHGIRVVPASTGVAVVLYGPTDKRMVVASGANEELTLEQFRSVAGSNPRHVHLASLDDERALPILALARAQGATTSCEFNGLQSERRVRHCDLCFMNRDELARWLGSVDPFTAWNRRFKGVPTTLAVTEGADGASVVAATEVLRCDTERVEVVDRTGGGDAFNAGFLTGFLDHRQWRDCLQMGLRLARDVIQRRGARPDAVKPSPEPIPGANGE